MYFNGAINGGEPIEYENDFIKIRFESMQVFVIINNAGVTLNVEVNVKIDWQGNVWQMIYSET